MFCSIKILLNGFFLVIFIIAWAIPVALVLNGANTTVSNCIADIGEQISDLIRTKIKSQFTVRLAVGDLFANWTHIHGIPTLVSDIKRQQFENVVLGQMLNSLYTGWVYAYIRYSEGSESWIKSAAPGILSAQVCTSSNGIWKTGNQDPNEISNYTRCDVQAVDRASQSLVPASNPLSTQLTYSYARSFAWTPIWNATLALINSPAWPANETGGYFQFWYVAQADGMVLGFFRVASNQFDMSRPLVGMTHGMPSSAFESEMRALLPTDTSRMFFIEPVGRVVFSSHAPSVELRPYTIGAPLDAGCWPNANNTGLACQHNISTYREYELVRIWYRESGDAYGKFRPQSINFTFVTSPDGTKYYAARRPVKQFISVFTILVFIPLDYWTKAIQDAQKTVIIVCCVMIVVGALLTYLLLRVVTRRVEDLAQQMYQDPFAKTSTSSSSRRSALSKKLEHMKLEREEEDRLEQKQRAKQRNMEILEELKRLEKAEDGTKDNRNSASDQDCSDKGLDGNNKNKNSNATENAQNNNVSGDGNKNSTQNNDNNNASDEGTSICNISNFCAFTELVQLEDEFANFRETIEQLRSFMPADFGGKKSKKSGAGDKSKDTGNSNGNNHPSNQSNNSSTAESSRLAESVVVDGRELNEQSSSTTDETLPPQNQQKTLAESSDNNPVGGEQHREKDNSISNEGNPYLMSEGLNESLTGQSQQQTQQHTDPGALSQNSSLLSNDNNRAINTDVQNAHEETDDISMIIDKNNNNPQGSPQILSIVVSPTAGNNNNNNNVANTSPRNTNSGLSEDGKASTGSTLRGILKTNQPRQTRNGGNDSTGKAAQGSIDGFLPLLGMDNGAVVTNNNSAENSYVSGGAAANNINNNSNVENEASTSATQLGRKKSVKFIVQPAAATTTASTSKNTNHKANNSESKASKAKPSPSSNVLVIGQPAVSNMDDGDNESLSFDDTVDPSGDTRMQSAESDVSFFDFAERDRQEKQYGNDASSDAQSDASSVASSVDGNGSEKNGADGDILSEAFGHLTDEQKKERKRRKNLKTSIVVHRCLFASIHVQGTYESAGDVWNYEMKKSSMPDDGGIENEEERNGRSVSRENFDDEVQFGFSQEQHVETAVPVQQNNSTIPLARKMFTRQKLLDRSRLIAEIINNDVIESSGAHLIEYRNDTFYAVLRLSKRETQSKLAYRFVCKLIDAANKLAEHDLQHAYNFAEGRKPHAIALSAGLAVGDARFLSLPITAGETIARPVTVLSACVRDAVDVERRMRYTAAGSSPYRPLSHAIGYYVAGTTHDTLAISSFTSDLFNPAVRVPITVPQGRPKQSAVTANAATPSIPASAALLPRAVPTLTSRLVPGRIVRRVEPSNNNNNNRVVPRSFTPSSVVVPRTTSSKVPKMNSGNDDVEAKSGLRQEKQVADQKPKILFFLAHKLPQIARVSAPEAVRSFNSENFKNRNANSNRKKRGGAGVPPPSSFPPE